MSEHERGTAGGPVGTGGRDLSRRDLIRSAALAGAGLSVAGMGAGAAASGGDPGTTAAAVSGGIEEMTIAELQRLMERGELTSVEIVDRLVGRIRQLDSDGPRVSSVVELNPDAWQIAAALDRERAEGEVRGPLHGIPVLIKENIDTGDRMLTTAGSLALAAAPASRDATVVERLRLSGAVLLGKANLSEWANFRSFHSSSGWSGRGGQTANPHVLDRNPSGSSSGSAAAVAAGFVPAALGTETDGSILCPANMCGVVGIKPTVGLTSRAGVVPVAHTQDTVGTFGRTVADAAAALSALVGADVRDPQTLRSEGKYAYGYTRFVSPDGLRGARIGVCRNTFTGASAVTDAVLEEAIRVMADAGAVVVDPAEIPTAEELLADPAEIIVLVYEFKRDLAAYLATRSDLQVRTLADVIAWNEEHASVELAWFGQELFYLCEMDAFTDEDYADALPRSLALGGTRGVDAALKEFGVDALVAPTMNPASPTDLVNGDHYLCGCSSPCAMAGYPAINVPAGNAWGLPIGITFMGTAWSEPTLIRLASGFEHAAQARLVPRFRKTLPAPLPERPAFSFGKGALLGRLARSSRRTARELLAQLPRPRLL